ADWLCEMRENLAERYSDALRVLVKELERADKLALALPYAEQAVAIHPLWEEAHGDLIRLYMALGRRADALRQCDRLEHILAEELDAELSLTSEALMAEVRGGAPRRLATEQAGPLEEVRLVTMLFARVYPLLETERKLGRDAVTARVEE